MLKQSCYFIVGTDTSCGKTYVTCQLLAAAKALGKKAVGLKPIASGADALGRNEDALSLQAASAHGLSYQQVNPFCYQAPVSPNIAASWEKKSLSVDEVVTAVNLRLKDITAQHFVEGVGGLCVPLNENETCLELLKCLKIPVILVVGLKLGCLNHALLTLDCLLRNRIKVAGWVANQIDPEMLAYEENLMYLKKNLSVPCLAEVKYGGTLEYFNQ